MHACACVGMVENNKKCSKIIKNILFSSCPHEAHVRFTNEFTTDAQKLKENELKKETIMVIEKWNKDIGAWQIKCLKNEQ